MSSTTSNTSRRTSSRMPVPRLLQSTSSTPNKRAKTTATSSIATTQLTEEREAEEEEGQAEGSSESKSKSTSTNGGGNKRKAALPLPSRILKPTKIIPGINSISPIFPLDSTDKPRGVFYWGDGGSNQFGCGSENTDEVTRPELHSWVQDKIKGDGNVAVKGFEKGMAGLECGGMHSIGLDGDGNVSFFFGLGSFYLLYKELTL